MHKGKVEADGPTDAVIGAYQRRENAGVASRQTWLDDNTAPGDHQLRLRSAFIQAAGAHPDQPIDVATPFVITVTYDNFVDGAQINLAIVVFNEMGSIIFSAGPTAPPFDQPVGRYSETCHVPGNLMNDGNYFISVEVRDRGKLLLSLPAVLTVSIEDSSEGRHGWFGKWEGAVRPLLQWTTERL
jgi:lipopolysaccharide transport system ATP-binding protein